ncbi:hypothetical protein [Bacillus sp. FJAT-27245]|uniref:hypothetical protein n=1 Tax=Bacillus sp. FJAT-27245 TaxID=1684144 RepID=UPI0006A7A6A8|nr:hypothetical protein [Bacillus sp. FJAT-27245]
MIKAVQNDKGNTMLFILGSISIMALMFIIVGSFANVFVYKEKAANNAEQASIVASANIYENLQRAVDDYDRSLIGVVEDFLSESINEKISQETDRLKNSHPDFSDLEARYKAVDRVLKRELGRNPILSDYISAGLRKSSNEIPYLVQQNIEDNGGEVSNTRILLFNHNNRVEVKTAAAFKALGFDELFPDDKRNIRQSGQGPKFEFIKSLSGWSNRELTLP